MKLTPLDIQQQQFRTTLWGFDQKEVDAFLDLVATSFEELIRDNHALRDELRRRESQLEEHRERERTLKETMITATRVSEDIKEGARKEAEIIIGAAEVQAEQIIQNAHTRLVRIMEDINELKRQKAQFEGMLRSTITTHQKLLEAMTEREPSSVEGDPINIVRRRSLSSERREKEKDAGPAKSGRPKLAPVDDAPSNGVVPATSTASAGSVSASEDLALTKG